MRVAYVCTDAGVPVFGNKGCSLHVRGVIDAMLEHGMVVDLFASRLDGTRPRHWDAVAVHELPAPAGAHGITARRERAAIRGNALLRRGLTDAGGFDLVYERYSLWSYAGMERARDWGVPGVLEVNAPLIEEQARYRELVHHAAAERILRRATGAASLVVAVSAQVAQYVRAHTDPATRVEVVPNGTDMRGFVTTRRVRECRTRDPFTVGFVGTLKPWHGTGVLAEAFIRLHGRLPGSRLLIIGDGPELASLQTRLATLPHDAVHFTGSVPRAQIPQWLRSVDVAVAPYPAAQDCYFSPLKVFEYMAAGLPIVASDTGQISDIIRHRQEGVLVEPGNPRALCEALVRIRQNPEWAARLGARARAKARREHTWARVLERIVSAVAAPAAMRRAAC